MRTNDGVQFLGKNTSNLTTVPINGVLVGLAATSIHAIIDVNFKYVKYSLFDAVEKLPVKLSNVVQASTGGVAFDYQFPSTYISQITYSMDTKNNWYICQTKFTFTGIDGNTSILPKEAKLGTGANPNSITSGVIVKFDYTYSNFIDTIDVSYDATAIIGIRFLFTDNSVQNIGGFINTHVQTFKIGGYLVGISGKADKFINSIQFKYKVHSD